MKTSTMLLLAAAAGGGYLLYRRSQNTAAAAAAAPVVSTTTPISTPTGAAVSLPGILTGILGALKPGAQVMIKETGDGILSPPIMPTRPAMVAGTLGDHTLKCGRNGTLS